MNCQDCELLLAEGESTAQLQEHLRECRDCRTLAEDLSANALALESLRNEDLPRMAIRTPRRRLNYVWIAAAAAAVLLLALPAPETRPPVRPVAPEPPREQVAQEPLPQGAGQMTIKMLTPDPSVVIYWLVDN